ncbi:MAG: transposase [Elusimicrobia bacterium]|nr:transposase [Elusimicrobiota bacterium]
MSIGLVCYSILAGKGGIMPRQARIDIPGQLYHVMSRGIERGTIFLEETDYVDFVERFSIWLEKSGGKCLAWCLMPNHFHFLVLRGLRPLSEIMHHVMTGYAINFNGRHQRVGHLFQNRYKAIICDVEGYLLELIPYIHLNPLRAKLVRDLADLENYKWCGHAAITKGVADNVLDRDEVLAHFGDNERSAVEKYRVVMAEKAREGERLNLSGGGLLRSSGGMNGTLRAFRAGHKVFFDQRILGEGDFVEAVLKAAGEAGSDVPRSRVEVLADVERSTGVAREDILRSIRDRGPARARAVYCYLCKEKAKASGTELMRELGISQSAVSRLIAKGRRLIESGEIAA